MCCRAFPAVADIPSARACKKFLGENVFYATIVAVTCEVKAWCYHVCMKEVPCLAAAFGQTLRTHREQGGLTQRELAARIGSVTSYIRFLEYGQKMPTLGTFHLLCAALTVDPHEFMAAYLQTMYRMRAAQAPELQA